MVIEACPDPPGHDTILRNSYTWNDKEPPNQLTMTENKIRGGLRATDGR